MGRGGMSGSMVAVWAAVCAAVLIAGVQAQASLKFGFKDEFITDDTNIPTDIAFLPGQGTRFLLLEKQGRVRLVVNGVVQNQDVFDMTSRVHSYLDRGAISIWVDINHSSNKYVYVFHAYENNANDLEGRKTGRLTRFKMNADGTKMASGSDSVILGTVNGPGCENISKEQDVICCDSYTHCVGDVTQNSNGHLFVSIGEGAFPQEANDLAMRSQDVDSLNGKILRIKRAGGAVSGNPWFTGSYTQNDNRSKVWSLGVRNSWRLSYDAALGAPWSAEVGWSKFEEVNLSRKESNGGWPCNHGDEAISAFSSFDGCVNYPVSGNDNPPAYFYGRNEGIASGAALRVSFPSWPNKYQGAIFHTDHVFGWMKYFTVDGQGDRTADSKSFAEDLSGPVRIIEGPGDCLWYVSIYSNAVRRICYEPDTSTPSVVSILPPSNSQNAEITTKVVVQFSKFMSSGVVNKIKLFKVDGEQAVAGSAEYDSGTYVLTFTPNNALDPMATYRVEVGKSAQDPEGRKMAAKFESTFSTGTGSSKYVSDLPFVSSTNAIGPVERDRMNGGSGTNDGDKIRLRDEIFDKGLGVCAVSEVVVDVPAGCTRFQSFFGIADEINNFDVGAVHAQVFVDGVKQFDTSSVHPDPLSRATPAVEIEVDLTGASRIKLAVVNAAPMRKNRQKSTWADARFRCGAFDAVPPEVDTVTPADGETDVPIDVGDIVLHFSEPMDQASLLASVRLTAGSEEVGWTPKFSNGLQTLTLELQELAYDTVHTVSVSRQARDLSGNRLKTAFDSTFRTAVQPATGSLVYISDLTPTTENFEFKGGQAPLTLADASGATPYNKGIGVRPAAWVDYTVPADCNTLEFWVGVDASTKGKGACNMNVKNGAKQKIFRRVVRGGETPKFISVAVTPGELIRVNAQPLNTQTAFDMCNWADIAFKCTTGDMFLSDLAFRKKKGIIQFDNNADGGKIRLGDGTDTVTYENGIVLHAGGTGTYQLPGSCSRFLGDVGALESAGAGADFKLQVKANNLPQCLSPRMKSHERPESIECPLTGATSVRFRLKDPDMDPIDDKTGVGSARLDCAVGTRRPSCEFTQVDEDFKVGDDITFKVKALDFLGRTLPASAVKLSLVQVHCSPCHEHNLDQVTGTKTYTTTVQNHGDTFFFQMMCEVCDGPDCATASANSFPQTATVTVESDPPGLLVGVDSASGPAPLTATVVVGSDVQLSTFQSQPPHTFDRWAHDASAGTATTVKVNGNSSFLVRFN